VKKEGGPETALGPVLERLDGIERQQETITRQLAALVAHTATLSQRHTRAVASLGVLNAAPGLLIGAKEIAAFMGVTPSTIFRWRTYGFPTWRLGRHIYSHVLDILAWMRQQNQRHRKASRRHASG